MRSTGTASRAWRLRLRHASNAALNPTSDSSAIARSFLTAIAVVRRTLPAQRQADGHSCRNSSVADETLWAPLDVGTLSIPGPFSYDTLYTPKDDDLLSKVYQRYHEVKPDEVEA